MVVVLFYNNLGLLMASGPVVLMMLAAVYLPNMGDCWFSWAFGGPIMLLWDLIYRSTRGGRRLFRPSAGGHLFFIPCWVLGGLLIWGYISNGRAEKRWLPRATEEKKVYPPGFPYPSK